MNISTADQNLCTSCNMCCNGQIFGRINVTKDERDRLGGGSDFVDNKEDLGLHLVLGCSRLGADGLCRRYDVRPKTCRTYECDLLKKVNASEIDEKLARSIVLEAKGFQERSVAATRAAVPAEYWPENCIYAKKAMMSMQDAIENGAVIPGHIKREALVQWLFCINYIRAHFLHDYHEESLSTKG